MSKNTSELWSVVPGFYPGFVEIFGASFKISVVTHAADISLVESMNRIEDARRIVACVNVCAGLPIEQLESAPLGGILNGVAGLVSQRDELLEERGRVGLAIDAALRDGVVPEQHPLRSRLEMLANHRQREFELLAALERLLPWAETMGGMSPDVKYTGDHPLAISRSAIAKAKGV